MSWRARRFWPLYLSLPCLAALIVLSVTPLAWNLMGRQPETYPELFFFLWGVPWALCLTAASVFIAVRGTAMLSQRLFAWAISGCLLLPLLILFETAIAYSHLRLPSTSYRLAQGEMIANWLVLATLLVTGLRRLPKKAS